MFRTQDIDKLRAQIDRFNVPMFVAELLPDGSGFQVLALNDAHEKQSGMMMEEVARKPLKSLLSKNEAAAVEGRYTRCITGEPQLRYREMLHMPRGALIWDTTLHHILPSEMGGADRIVGNAIVVERVQRDQFDTLAFEDVRYFATMSSQKLCQIGSVLDAVEDGRIRPETLAKSVIFLAGLCRTIDATMQELRQIAQGRLDAQYNPTMHLIQDSAESHDEVQQAIAALIKLSTDVPAVTAKDPETDIHPMQ